MARYIKLFSEFSNFVKEYKSSFSSEHEKKLINLLLLHFDDIVDTGLPLGKRAKLINQLIQKHATTVSSEIEIEEVSEEEKIFPFASLNSLEIENFRGFSEPETFNFNKQLTFIYGPNGSGKSSLCEAIEFALLGYINEAISKNIDINNYIKNAITGASKKPKLIGLDSEGNQIEILANPNSFNFIFVEKCRIENFSRISSNSPSKRQSLIATLFGLDEFNDFVKNFTENIGNYFDLKGVKGEELSRKSEAIKVHRDNVAKAECELLEIESQKSKILEELNFKQSFEELDELIHAPLTGRLDVLEAEILKPAKSKISVKSTIEILAIKSKADKILSDLIEINKEYEEKKDKVQFKELYEATLAIEDLVKDKCPVCFTPIESVTEHPYENARTNLKELKYISELEEKRNEVFGSLHSILSELSSTFSERNSIGKIIQYEKANIEYQTSFSDRLADIKTIIEEYNDCTKSIESLNEEFAEFDKLVEKHNQDATSEAQKKSELKSKRERLREISERMKKIQAKKDAITSNVKVWKKTIEAFEEENSELIKQAETEKTIVEQNISFSRAYESVITKLRDYNDKLPLKHLENLNNLTLEIYNSINSHDKTFEKARKILLPTDSDDVIKICFENDPDTAYDALQILSEGHIRCLGLAILLAKNIHDGCPVIIFDDIVNAIDDDHKGGVRKTIFEYQQISSKQIILTTHAEQFIKELEQHPSPKEYNSLVKKMSLVLDDNERKIRVKHNNHKNYLVQASSYFGDAEYSESLYCCRCSLECLSHKIWEKINRKKFQTEFSVVIRSPKYPPDLMSVILSINDFIKSNEVGDKLKSITEHLDYLTGLKVNGNVVWTYLNKGTHEESGRPEFDQLIVKEVIENLNKIDEKIKA